MNKPGHITQQWQTKESHDDTNTMRHYFIDKTVVIPLHLRRNFPADYIEQTAFELKKYGFVILFDFLHPRSWKEFITTLSVRRAYNFFAGLAAKKRSTIYLRPISIFPLQRNEWVYRLNVSAGIWQLKIIFLIFGVKPVLWGFNPIMEHLIGKIHEQISVYDCIDYYGNKNTKNLIKLESKLMTHVSCVIFNSSQLRSYKIARFPQIRSISTHVVCGCNTKLFHNPSQPGNINRSSVIFMGHIDYWVNIKLLEYLIVRNPKLQFTIIGPVDMSVKSKFVRLLQYRNIVYKGFIPKKMLPAYIRNAGVGIIPYDTSLINIRYCNPMKTYEYLAMGIPVVATDIPSISSFPSTIVRTTSTYKEFNVSLQHFITHWLKKDASIATSFARAHNWAQKVRQIEQFITTTII